jgi:hypothetical protein
MVKHFQAANTAIELVIQMADAILWPENPTSSSAMTSPTSPMSIAAAAATSSSSSSSAAPFTVLSSSSSPVYAQVSPSSSIIKEGTHIEGGGSTIRL